jgi:hypothetical protein
MTSKLSRVSLAASSLFDPTELAAPPTSSLRAGSGTHGSPHRSSNSTGQRKVARPLFDI